MLNREGEGLVLAPQTRLTLLPNSLGIFQTPETVSTATRLPGRSAHDFILIQLTLDAARRIFGPSPPLFGKSFGIIRRWSDSEARAFDELLDPPVAGPARPFWFHAKLIELFSLHLFPDTTRKPLFCAAVKNNAHRHVRRALELLHAASAEPLDLNGLADDVGCAPHYLSRLVRQDTGKTLSLHLRAFRIERAAELLARRNFNVTEVAFEVGYSSLSHFAKAFSAEKGVTPSQFIRRQN